MTVERSEFGTLRDGRTVDRFTLRNRRGTVAEVITFGGILKALRPAGSSRSVVLGYDTLAEYEYDEAHHGALIGRYANRIASGSFELDGRRYELSRNKGEMTLHGGFIGFDRRLWAAEALQDTSGVRLRYRSPDGEEGFPGSVDVVAEYALSEDDVLSLTFQATTDAPTVINLANHSYFNLSGSATIADHDIAIAADFFTPNDRQSLPTGEIRSVEGTPFDLREGANIGDRLKSNEEQIVQAGGFDHNFVIRRARADELALAARVSAGGRTMEVWTTEPGMQFYTGQFLGNRSGGMIPHEHARGSALCLETQHFPDSPHHANFPSTVLRPGETLYSRTEYRLFGR